MGSCFCIKNSIIITSRSLYLFFNSWLIATCSNHDPYYHCLDPAPGGGYLRCTLCGAESTPRPGSCPAGYRGCCWRRSRPSAASGPGRCSSCGAGTPLWATPRWRSCPADSARTLCRSPAFLEEMNHIFTLYLFVSHI